MKKFIVVSLYVVGGITLICAALVLFAFWSMSSDTNRFAATKKDLPLYVAGRWDWTIRGRPCGDSAHAVTFGPGWRTMEIRQEHESGKGGAGDPTVYDILEITPTRIRGAIRGETRKTPDGKPVVWDLVMFNVNEYHWHRTDWAAWGYTPAIIRCGPSHVAEAAKPPA